MQLNTEKMIGEKEGGVGWMTFNNPARRNAMALEMWSAVEAILDEFESDDAIKVIVMKGAGDKAFVSGADISEFKERRNNAEAAAEYARISEGARARLLAVKKPLIAMIQGYCLGGGMAVAMAADMRFASDDSQFGIPAARLSIAYGFDGLHKLVHLVGPAYRSDQSCRPAGQSRIHRARGGGCNLPQCTALDQRIEIHHRPNTNRQGRSRLRRD
jgi:enoyl-CoA hydratase